MAGRKARYTRPAQRLAAALFALALAVGAGEVTIGMLAGEKIAMPFGWGVVRVLSGSMEPTFSEGALLVVSRVASPDEVSAGDIVVYDEGESLVAHRVVEVSGGMAVTQGDANNAPDEPIELSQVKARAVAWTPPLALPGRALGAASASARYATRAQGADAARAACFAWDVRSDVPDGSEVAIQPGETALVDIEASNVRDENASEVSQTCTVRAACEGDVPIELSLKGGEVLEEDAAPGACSSASFPAGEAESRTFHLSVSLPADANLDALEDAESHVRVTVSFKQAHDDLGLIAGVEARYAHEETLDFTVRIASALQ